MTNAQYRLCVAVGECAESRFADDARYNEDNYPVVGVSWHDAVTYCTRVGGRLPTEAEWEYAARGEQGRIYPWGDTFDGPRRNFCDANCSAEPREISYDDGYERTAPVGNYPDGASWCDALDMAGNVWEWVADWYGDYPTGRQVNPVGPTSGEERVLRGGSWSRDQDHVGGATRGSSSPAARTDDVGFRCVGWPGD